jgi:hypothetical protein
MPSVCLRARRPELLENPGLSFAGRFEDLITEGIMSSRSGEIGGETELGEDRGEALRSQGCNEDIQGPPPSVDPGAVGLERVFDA